jgi:serine/threonine-protein kinase
VLVGVDGVSRITDFGLAKCAETSEQPTTQGTLKGKLGYMAPEYVRSKPIDARADVFAMGTVTWEALTGKRLFRGEGDADTIERVLTAQVAPPSSVASDVTPEIDAVVLRALERTPDARFPTIRAFAEALGAAGREKIASPAEVGALVRASMGGELDARRKAVGERPIADAPGATPPKKRRTAALGVGALVLVAVGAVAVARSRGESPPSPPAAPSVSSSPPPVAPSINAVPLPPPSATADASPPPTTSARPPKRHHSPAADPSHAPLPKAPPPNPYVQ